MEIENNIFQVPTQLDAGTSLVLESKGSWLNAGYHLTTAIVSPALLAIPFALSLLGWAGGMVVLTTTAVVTFYTYNIISVTLDHHGRNLFRFQDMAHSILGESNHARGVDRVFGIFTVISIMASQFGNGIFPEIQATLAPPVAGKMFKALAVCYSVVVSSFYSVGITGYWAFGNLSKGTVLHNIMVDSKSLTPEWLLFVINIIILAQVLATSVDPNMAALVRERFANTGQVKVVEEDFTKCNIESHLLSLLASTKLPNADRQCAKVVANIPFNISTDVVKQLLPMGELLSEVVLLLQETALRLTEPSLRTSEYRPISIFVSFYSDPEYKFKVPRSDFFPQPNVDAAVVTFRLKKEADYPSVSSIKSFFSLVNSAFNGKRKMLRRSLQHICTSLEIEAALGYAGLAATSRPEELTLDDFVRLHNFISKA